METELKEQPVDWGQPAAPAAEVSRESLLAEISAQENPQDVPATPQTPAPEQPGQPISPVQTEGQAKGTENSTTPPAAPTTGEPPKVETPALTETQLQEFLAKKHVPSQDTWKVVKMYQDAQKALTQKSMEVANLKKIAPIEQPFVQPVSQPVSPITGLPYTNTDPNAQLLEDLQQNPILTMRKVAELAYGSQVSQLAESLNEQKLHNTVVKLSTSPETAEFNLPVVQDEIKAIMTERPDLSGDLEKNLPILNDLAIGRLYRAGKLNKDAVEAGKKIAEQNIATRQAAVMEGANKQTPIVEKSFKDMTVEEQERYLKSQIVGFSG